MTALLRFVTSARVLWLVLPLLVLLIVALGWLADLFWFQALGYAAGLLAPAARSGSAVRRRHRHRVPLRVDQSPLLARQVDLSARSRRRARDVAQLLGRRRHPPCLIRAFELLAPLGAAIVVGFGFAARLGRAHPLPLGAAVRRDRPALRPRHRLLPVRPPVPRSDPEHARDPRLHGHRAAPVMPTAGPGSLGYRPGVGIVAPAPVLRHLLANAALFLFAWASGYVLDRYALLTEPTGPCSGPATPPSRHPLRALAARPLLTVLFALAPMPWSPTGRARPSCSRSPAPFSAPCS